MTRSLEEWRDFVPIPGTMDEYKGLVFHTFLLKVGEWILKENPIPAQLFFFRPSADKK